MSKLKLIFLFFAITILSYGQCGLYTFQIEFDGYSSSSANSLYILNQNDNQIHYANSSNWENNGGTSYFYSTCLDPGQYSFNILDENFNGINCGGNSPNGIWIYEYNYPNPIWELTCSTPQGGDYLNDNWAIKTFNFTVDESTTLSCDEVIQQTYSYINRDKKFFNYVFPEGSTASITISGGTEIYDDYIYFYDGSGNLLNFISGYFNEYSVQSNDNVITLLFDSDGSYSSGWYGSSSWSVSCQQNDILGCTNETATNYDSDATIDNGTCIILGCTNSSAENFNASATTDDGSCIIYGCTTETAINYNPEATVNDGICNLNCDAINQSSYSYENGDDMSFDYLLPEGEIASITLSGDTYSGDVVTINDGDGEPIAGFTGEFSDTTIESTDNGISIIFQDFTEDENSASSLNLEATSWTISCAALSCDKSYPYNYAYTNNDNTSFDYIFPEGEIAIMTISGQTEACCDFINVNNGVGNALDTLEGDFLYPPRIIVSNDNGISLTFISDIGTSPANPNGFNLAQSNWQLSCAVQGCMNEIADNYDALANFDDGSCVISGCQDATACNYNVNATDSAQCIYSEDLDECATCSGETNGTGTIVDNDADNDGVCDADEIVGCQDATACNYNVSATDSAQCIYSEDLDECATCSGETNGTGTIVDNDADNDGVCDADEIVGCQDATACNYNVNATDSAQCFFVDGICETCSGAQDGTGTIVDNDADNDGICDSLEVAGCQDATACNYNVSATDSAQCIYSEDLDECATCSGETNGTGTIVDNDADNDGVCDADEIVGCQDATACNYNVSATDSAQCLFVDGICETCSGETDGTGIIVDNDADNDGVCNTDELDGCINPLACNYDVTPTTNSDSTLCIYATDLDACATCSGETDGTGTIVDNDADDDGVCDSLEVAGCQDATACNFNEMATDPDACVYAADLDACATCSGETDGTGTIVDNDADDDGVCDSLEVAGCQDATACNFNEIATDPDACVYAADLDACATCSGETDGTGTIVDNDADDDGICDSDELDGCIDPLACNYDDTATESSDCIYSSDLDACATCSGETDGTGTIVDNDADDDGICDADEIAGCQDTTACNYDNTATDAGECNYLDGICETCLDGSIIDNDADDDGVCDADELVGCQDSIACNFDTHATDAGPCTFVDGICESCSGETDGTGIIVDNDIDNDGVCNDNEVEGCTYSNACNYNPFATNYDLSCFWPDILDCDGNCINDQDLDGVCDENEILGCNDASSCNYDSLATDNDGSCEFPLELYTCEGNCILDDDGDGICNALEIIGCLDNNACNYSPNVTDIVSCVYPDAFYDCNGNCLNDVNNNSICDELEVEGCTNSEACNFNANANIDDNSCEFAEQYYNCDGTCLNDEDQNGICDEFGVLGCMDSDACNFNANATVDDETCEYVEVTLEYNYSSLLLIANSNLASPTYQWNINEEETNITSDRVDAFFEGIYTVTVIDEENNCWGEASYTINGVSILEISSTLNLYPNPVYSILNIKTKLNISNTTIEIYNILGELCKIHHHMNADGTQIDVTQLNSGMYSVKIKSKDFIIQKEFIKY